MSFLKSIPFEEESVMAVIGRYQDQAQALFALTQLVMREGDTTLSAGQRELIAAYTSVVNSCDYCYGTHKATAEAFGVEETLLEVLASDINAAQVDENMKPVLHYVRKLTLEPSKMVQGDVDDVFDAGWNENDFHYIVMACALFNFFNRMIDGYGIKNAPDYRAQRGEYLAAKGYKP